MHACVFWIRRIGWAIVAIALGPAAAAEARDAAQLRLPDGSMNTRLFKFVGPNANDAIDVSPGRLTIKLPTDLPGRLQVGVQTKFGVVGNFTATARYEWVDVEKPTKGAGAGVKLRLVLDTPPHQRKAILARLHGSVGRQTYMTNIYEDKGAGKSSYAIRYYPTSSVGGSLRLERTGKDLRYLVAEGNSNEFRELRREELGDQNLLAISLLGDTGGSPTSLTVRLTGLSIEADKFDLEPPAVVAKRSRSSWLVPGGVVLAFVIAVGVYRWRSRAVTKPTGPMK